MASTARTAWKSRHQRKGHSPKRELHQRLCRQAWRSRRCYCQTSTASSSQGQKSATSRSNKQAQGASSTSGSQVSPYRHCLYCFGIFRCTPSATTTASLGCGRLGCSSSASAASRTCSSWIQRAASSPTAYATRSGWRCASTSTSSTAHGWKRCAPSTAAAPRWWWIGSLATTPGWSRCAACFHPREGCAQPQKDRRIRSTSSRESCCCWRHCWSRSRRRSSCGCIGLGLARCWRR